MTRKIMPLLAIMLSAAPLRAGEREGPWLLNDWPAAQRQASAQNLPIFVIFH